MVDADGEEAEAAPELGEVAGAPALLGLEVSLLILCLFVKYIYIYIYTYREREREI